MLDAVPASISPSPGAPFGAQHERHDQAEKRNEGEQCDEGIVADAPYPIEQEGAPVPAVDFRRDGSRLVANARVHHGPNPVERGHDSTKRPTCAAPPRNSSPE